METEHPRSLLMRDPEHASRWLHKKRDASHLDWYRQVTDDVFEKMGTGTK